MLEPFLFGLANCRNRIIINRIIEKVFEPLLENNVTTHPDSSDSEDENGGYANYDYVNKKFLDGGKMNPRTRREVLKLID